MPGFACQQETADPGLGIDHQAQHRGDLHLHLERVRHPIIRFVGIARTSGEHPPTNKEAFRRSGQAQDD